LARTEDTVAGGGRYDGLVSHLGGEDTFSCGFALGVERVVSLIGEKNCPGDKILNSIFVAVTEEKMDETAIVLGRLLRKENFVVIGPFPDKSLKSQLRLANTFNADFTIILGEEELSKEKLIVKNMKSQTQKEVSKNRIVETLRAEVSSQSQ
jgi:histidyl-tRNA synthetase